MIYVIIALIIFPILLGIHIFRYGGAGKVISLGLFVVLILGYHALFLESIGRSKPIDLEWIGLSGAELIGYVEQEDKIHVWLLVNNEPRVYIMDRTNEVLAGLYNAQQQAGETGTVVLNTNKKEKHGEEFTFHPRPPEESPPK